MTTEPAPLDGVYLADIYEAGGEGFAREVMETFLAEADRRTRALREALAGADWPGAALAAHGIVSGSSMLGLTAISAAARGVEHTTGAQRRPTPETLAALEALIHDARPVLEHAIAELATQQGSMP